MPLAWQRSHTLLRRCAVQSIALFAATGTAVQAQTKEDCFPGKAELVWRMNFDECRPGPISSAEKAAVLRLLPAEDLALQPDRGERAKLDAIELVLRVHGREGIYDVRVITVPQAWTGLYERAVLLISRPALTLLHVGELQALVAHEIGHEYVWEEYAGAKVRRDTKRIRELELVCDAISVRTLMRMGLPPKLLQTATEKVFWYNRERLGVALDEGDYPSLKERRQLIKRLSLFER